MIFVIAVPHLSVVARVPLHSAQANGMFEHDALASTSASGLGHPGDK